MTLNFPAGVDTVPDDTRVRAVIPGAQDVIAPHSFDPTGTLQGERGSEGASETGDTLGSTDLADTGISIPLMRAVLPASRHAAPVNPGTDANWDIITAKPVNAAHTLIL